MRLNLLPEYHEKIRTQEKYYAFVPINVNFNANILQQTNHWIALIVDKRQGLIFYLNPKNITVIPEEIKELHKTLGYAASIVCNPIDFHEKEKTRYFCKRVSNHSLLK